LQNSEKYKSYFIEQNMQEALFTAKRAACINFTDDDLLIGTIDHNRPLYIIENCGGQKVGRFLVDAGFSINIMPLKTLKTITLDVKNLSDEKVIIHGFNQNSQKALGAITLNLQCGSLKAPTKFYVIDAETSYRALLGRRWLHSSQVIASTLHQCLKYIENGKQKRIDGDVKPFGVHEIKFNDAQYFLPKSATAPSRPITKAGQKSFNKGPKFDTSSREEEDVKFNLKPRNVRTQRPGRKSGEEATFHFKQVATYKAQTKPSEVNSSDSEEEVIFNFKPANAPQIQITEVTSGEDYEESDESGGITSGEESGHGRQPWEEESDEEIIYHILKKPYKGSETDNESEESFMINVGSGSGRDNPIRPRPVSEERSWRENFEARIWNIIDEMRHQIENNRREVSEQWEVMQDIKVQHNEIMIMIENLQTAIYNSELLKEMTSEPRSGTTERQAPDSGKRVIVIVDEPGKEETKVKQSAIMQTLKAKKSRSYSFRKSKTTRIFEQALKSGLTLPACKRPADIDKANEGEFCHYHRILGHTIEECWVFKDLIEKGYKDGTIQHPKSFQQDPTPHNSNNKGKGVAYTISHTTVPNKPKL
jgi:hypothetical protein